MSDRSLGAILFADVAGYSRLMGQNEQLAQKLVKHAVRSFESHCEKNSGQVQQVRGDGVFALFTSSVNALECAMDAQKTLEGLGQEEDMPVQMRVGLHLGEVMRDETGAYGDSINVAARLEGLADPGGVCVSAAVYDQVKNRLAFGYECMGLQTLKNISEPVEVYKVLRELPAATQVASPRSRSSRERQRTQDRPSIAVLPFTNLSGDPADQWLSDGITQDVTSNLSKFHNLFVIARNSAFVYRDRTVSAKQAAHELGVRYISQGSVRKVGNRIRVSIELADALEDQMIWGEKYDRVLEDVFEVQDDITSMVVAGTAVQIDSAERKRALITPPSLLEAYSLSVKGQQHIFKYRREDNAAAQQLYGEANRLDAEYARAAAGISRSLNVGWRYNWIDESEHPLDRALEYAQNAVLLDQSDARGYGELGYAHLYRKEHSSSLIAYERAVTLNPNDADLLADMADALTHCSRSSEAIELLNRAMQLNPYFPDVYLWHLGGAYYNERQYEEAISAISRMNNPAEGHRLLAASYAQLNNQEQARLCAERVMQTHPGFSLDQWASIQPDLNSDDMMHFIEGLKKAGLK